MSWNQHVLICSMCNTININQSKEERTSDGSRVLSSIHKPLPIPLDTNKVLWDSNPAFEQRAIAAYTPKDSGDRPSLFNPACNGTYPQRLFKSFHSTRPLAFLWSQHESLDIQQCLPKGPACVRLTDWEGLRVLTWIAMAFGILCAFAKGFNELCKCRANIMGECNVSTLITLWRACTAQQPFSQAPDRHGRMKTEEPRHERTD